MKKEKHVRHAMPFTTLAIVSQSFERWTDEQAASQPVYRLPYKKVNQLEYKQHRAWLINLLLNS